MAKVMVFGVFDGIHEGHRALFREAKKYGKYLVAVVAQDRTVEYLKGHLPKYTLAKRIEDLQKEKLVNEVALGDAEPGSYEVILKHRPDVLALGYDQEDFKENLEENLERFDWRPEIAVCRSYEPEKYHSHLLHFGKYKN
ncbi:MAG: adenylyltransferase/cytidyltransferase family protein [Candidatus Liptonbacteria bacterium]|nr:adenylyltransferase/cytidyltransferase family protein [Candidatus Liptonbacteria bacterium]